MGIQWWDLSESLLSTGSEGEVTASTIHYWSSSFSFYCSISKKTVKWFLKKKLEISNAVLSSILVSPFDFSFNRSIYKQDQINLWSQARCKDHTFSKIMMSDHISRISDHRSLHCFNPKILNILLFFANQVGKGTPSNQETERHSQSSCSAPS